MTNELIRTVLLWILGGALVIGTITVALALLDGELSEFWNRRPKGFRRWK